MGEGQKRCAGCQSDVDASAPNCPKCGWDLKQAAAPDVIWLDPLPSGSTPAAPPPEPTVVVGPAPAPAPAPSPVQPVPIPAPAPAAVPGGGRPHSPAVALACGLLIPGAGQAYNGRPIRGFFVLFLTPLILPWLLSLWGAWSTASRMRAEGGRFGAGGFVWVVLQAWLAGNVALAVLIGLTIAGVVR
jgi:TM2 domain-containing membrane protein YozV